MTTEERLENLERELARAKRRNRWLVIGAAICLGIVFACLFFTRPGRYALSSGVGGVYVLDTRTGQLWARGPGRSIYLGTNDNPKEERKETP